MTDRKPEPTFSEHAQRINEACQDVAVAIANHPAILRTIKALTEFTEQIAAIFQPDHTAWARRDDETLNEWSDRLQRDNHFDNPEARWAYQRQVWSRVVHWAMFWRR